MFDKLRTAFANIVSDIGKKEISNKDLENTLYDLEIALLEGDVAQEVIVDIFNDLKNKLLGLLIEKGQTAEEIIRLNLKKSIHDILVKCGSIDLIKEIYTKKEKKSGPFVVVFLGINGTGKTTTVAKVANILRKNGLSVILAASDTHRAGAIEQLAEHAKRLSLKMIHQRYGADPSAVARDAVEYGKKHRVDAILIDTAGRIQTAKNLMDEISKIVQVVKPDLKIFVGDSLAGNDAIYQAREFFAYTKFDGSILTKTDADSKGGAIISISYLTSKPIMYLGVGQDYDDIINFDHNRFIESLFDFETTNEMTNLNNQESKNHTSKNKSKINNADISINKIPVNKIIKTYLLPSSNTHSLETKNDKITTIQPSASHELKNLQANSNYNNENKFLSDSKLKDATENIKSDEKKNHENKQSSFSSVFRNQKFKTHTNFATKQDKQKTENDIQVKSQSDHNDIPSNIAIKKDNKNESDKVIYLSDEDLDELLE